MDDCGVGRVVVLLAGRDVGSATVWPLTDLSLPISIASIWALARINLFFVYFAYAGYFFLTPGRPLSNVQALSLLTINNACARVIRVPVRFAM